MVVSLCVSICPGLIANSFTLLVCCIVYNLLFFIYFLSVSIAALFSF